MLTRRGFSLRTVLVPVILAGLSTAALAQSLSENWARCESNANDDLSVRACTALLVLPAGEAKPDVAGIFYNRGAKYSTRSQYDLAIRDFDEAIRLNPSYTEAFGKRGLAYARKGQHDRAVQDFDRTIQLKADDADAFFNRGLAYANQGQYARAIPDYEEAIKLKPDDARNFRGRGLAYAMNGQYGRALPDYNQAIKLKPDDARNFSSRGEVNFYRARWQEAATDLQRSLAIDPLQPYVVLWLHIAKKQRGQDDVREFSRQAARMDPSEWPAPVARLFLGQATPDQVLAAAASTDAQTGKDQRCEAAFYLGAHALLQHRTTDAVSLLQQARDTCPKTFIEYEGAVSELKRLGK